MNYKIVDNICHITHNDSDALGCALVVDICKGTEGTTHIFNSIEESKLVLSNITDCLESICINNTENSEMISIFKKYAPHQPVEALGIICIPKNIIITDLPVDIDILDRLNYISQIIDINLLYIDHHTSNLSNDLRHKWCHIKSTDDHGKLCSACSHLFTHLFLSDNIATGKLMQFDNCNSFVELILDISRYDTWLWKTEPKEYPTENYTTILIESYGDIYTAYERILHEFIEGNVTNDLTDVPVFKELIEIDENKRKSYIDRYMKQVAYFTNTDKIGIVNENYNNTKCAMVILPELYGNSIMENIYLTTYTDIVIGLYPSSKTISLRRSPNCNIDLSKIAKAYGGGGHKAAAGAKLNTATFMMYLTTYYALLDNSEDNGVVCICK